LTAIAPKGVLVAAWIAVFALGAGASSSTAATAETVQIPVDALLNTRSVTTLTGGMLVSWIMGINGGGTADGYLTAAASTRPPLSTRNSFSSSRAARARRR